MPEEKDVVGYIYGKFPDIIWLIVALVLMTFATVWCTSWYNISEITSSEAFGVATVELVFPLLAWIVGLVIFVGAFIIAIVKFLVLVELIKYCKTSL